MTGYIIRQSVGQLIGTMSTGNGGGSWVSGEALGSSRSAGVGSESLVSVSESESGSSLFHSSSEWQSKHNAKQ